MEMGRDGELCGFERGFEDTSEHYTFGVGYEMAALLAIIDRFCDFCKGSPGRNPGCSPYMDCSCFTSSLLVLINCSSLGKGMIFSIQSDGFLQSNQV